MKPYFTDSTGTITTVVGSTTVTGSSTSWDVGTDIDAGSILALSGDTSRFYVVASVDSTTSLTLTEPYLGTAGSGQAYTAKAIETVSGTVASRSGRKRIISTS